MERTAEWTALETLYSWAVSGADHNPGAPETRKKLDAARADLECLIRESTELLDQVGQLTRELSVYHGLTKGCDGTVADAVAKMIEALKKRDLAVVTMGMGTAAAEEQLRAAIEVERQESEVESGELPFCPGGGGRYTGPGVAA